MTTNQQHGNYVVRDLKWLAMPGGVRVDGFGVPMKRTTEPRILHLDRLAISAIRYEMNAPAGEQEERRRELEDATARSCGEWFRRAYPNGVRPGEEQYERDE